VRGIRSSREVPSAGRPAPDGRSTLLRYWLFQLPGTLAVAALLAFFVRTWDLSPRLAALFMALWVLKDIALYPLVRRAYERRSGGGADALLGALATARDRLDPEGYVRVGHELWRARLREGVAERGASLRVLAVRGLTLVVEVAEPEERR
jgi:membrane protein implicated in regulation of membrane protease activity